MGFDSQLEQILLVFPAADIATIGPTDSSPSHHGMVLSPARNQSIRKEHTHSLL